MKVRNERGASAVEFALVATLLFLILFGVIQFGIIFNRYQGAQAAGREGARLGSLTQTTIDDILQRVKDSLSIVNPANVALCTSGTGTPTLSEDHGCVRVSRRQVSGGALTWHNTTGQPGPCNESQAGSGTKSVVVETFVRTRLNIPLWASPLMTLKGTGEFKCEG